MRNSYLGRWEGGGSGFAFDSRIKHLCQGEGISGSGFPEWSERRRSGDWVLLEVGGGREISLLFCLQNRDI